MKPSKAVMAGAAVAGLLTGSSLCAPTLLAVSTVMGSPLPFGRARVHIGVPIAGGQNAGLGILSSCYRNTYIQTGNYRYIS